MAAAEPVSETEIESTLRIDPDYAIELLDAYYQEQIIQYIKRVTWGGSSPMSLWSPTRKPCSHSSKKYAKRGSTRAARSAW